MASWQGRPRRKVWFRLTGAQLLVASRCPDCAVLGRRHGPEASWRVCAAHSDQFRKDRG